MDAKTQDKVNQMKAYVTRNKHGGNAIYRECKRELEILDVSPKEFDSIIIHIAKELGI